MRDNSGLFAWLAFGFICVVAGVWWLSGWLDVSVEVTIRFLKFALLVGVIYGGWSWFEAQAGRSNPWPFLFPGLWAASWPLVIAKGTSTPEFMTLRGVDPGFSWWATPTSRWLCLVVLAALATWVYRRANSYR